MGYFPQGWEEGKAAKKKKNVEQVFKKNGPQRERERLFIFFCLDRKVCMCVRGFTHSVYSLSFFFFFFFFFFEGIFVPNYVHLSIFVFFFFWRKTI